MRILIIGGAVLAAAFAASAADVAVEGAPASPGAAFAAAGDEAVELSWDNGTRRWSIAWYTGAGAWVGNDFNISTMSAYRGIEKIRFYSRDNWPNSRWDGCRIGIYSFASVPGSLLWGPKFVVGSGSGYVWCDFNVGWTLPESTTAFVAAVEQFYNYPNCDSFSLDTNATYRGHSWEYYGGSWSPLSTAGDPYRNLMLRVVVNNATLDVAPSSLGRVKSLFY